MKIGSVQLTNNLILAPLAGITNLPFRLLAKESGCGMVCSEMVSANGLIHHSPKTERLMDSAAEEKPLSVQIFGAKPEIMAEAAGIVESTGADILDINFGCSVKKVVKTGAGAALMRTPDTARTVIRAVRQTITIPLSIKIRSGWDHTGAQALELARIAEDCGVDAIAVHPRTATQGFGGKADWSIIAAVKQAVSIPVIGNGDIVTAGDATRMLENTGCDGIMIGRAAIGNPGIFSGILSHMNNAPERAFDLAVHFSLMVRFLDASIQYFGEAHAVRMMRSRLGWFVKGLPLARKFRESITQITSRAQALELIHQYREQVLSRENGTQMNADERR